jgi:hypothetical protein
MGQKTSQFWLTGVRYLEGRRAMVLQFSQLNIRRVARLPFFPSFFVAKKVIGFEELKKVLLQERKRFKLEQLEQTLKVTASTFSALNCLANTLFKETGLRSLVLMPERQFLLEKDWGYFDCFTFFSERNFAKSGFVPLPKVKLPFFSEPLHETVQQLSKEDRGLAEKILGLVKASNCLKLPIADLPDDLSGRERARLQNTFWKSGLAAGEKPVAALARQRPSRGKAEGF